MKIYKMTWELIDLAAYYGIADNYIIDSGVEYSTERQKLVEKLPRTEIRDSLRVKVEEIEVEE